LEEVGAEVHLAEVEVREVRWLVVVVHEGEGVRVLPLLGVVVVVGREVQEVQLRMDGLVGGPVELAGLAGQLMDVEVQMGEPEEVQRDEKEVLGVGEVQEGEVRMPVRLVQEEVEMVQMVVLQLVALEEEGAQRVQQVQKGMRR
jgi:hypothetical protein